VRGFVKPIGDLKMDVNEIQQYLPKGAVVREGEYRKVMPQLLAEGFTPVTPAWVMDARNKQPELFDTWIDTGLGVSGNEKTVTFHPTLLQTVNPKTKLSAGGFFVPKDYSGSYGTFDRAEIGPLDCELTEKEALEHQGWLFLAEGDTDRHAKNVEKSFKVGKDRFGYDRMMGFHVAKDGNVRALVFDRTNGRAYAVGNGYMGGNFARLVGVRSGVAPEGREQVSTGSNGSLEALLKECNLKDVAELRRAAAYFNHNREMLK